MPHKKGHISKQAADNATKVLRRYYSQQAKEKSKTVYKKGSAAAKRGAKSFGNWIKKILTTK